MILEARVLIVEDDEDVCEHIKNLVYTQEGSSRISIKTKGGTIFFIEPNSISYIEKVKDKKYLRLQTDMGCYYTIETLYDFEDRLPAQFYRCHKSFIINLERVITLLRDGLNTFFVLLDSGKYKVPVGKYHHKDLLSLLNG